MPADEEGWPVPQFLACQDLKRCRIPLKVKILHLQSIWTRGCRRGPRATSPIGDYKSCATLYRLFASCAVSREPPQLPCRHRCECSDRVPLAKRHAIKLSRSSLLLSPCRHVNRFGAVRASKRAHVLDHARTSTFTCETFQWPLRTSAAPRRAGVFTTTVAGPQQRLNRVNCTSPVPGVKIDDQ